MSAYVIVSYDIVDQKAYEPYLAGVVPLLKKHGAEIVVADFDAKPLEGDRRSVYVVLRFPSEDAARAWHADPDYAAVKQIRFDTCKNNNMVIAKPASPPAD